MIFQRVHDADAGRRGHHIADVGRAVESKDWEVDYYMTCVYERHVPRPSWRNCWGSADPGGRGLLAA